MASCVRSAFVAAAVVLLAPAFAEASTPEERVLDEINKLRAEHGVPPLRHSRSLSRTSRRFATHLLRVDRVRHAKRIWASRRFRRTGENLAWQHGAQRSARRVLAIWKRSAHHRRLLLDDRLEWGGVGRRYGRLGRRRATVWVLQLGTR